jgi:hypothetical protein
MKKLSRFLVTNTITRLLMVRSILFSMLMVLVTSNTVEARESGFGLGIIVGEPTGISSKLYIGNDRAIDAAVAWSYDDENSFHLHGDFLVHKFFRDKALRHRLHPYYGLGGRFKFESKTKVGVRIPLGLNYVLAKSSLHAFFEIVPLLDLVPDTEFDLNGAIGIRYFF